MHDCMIAVVMVTNVVPRPTAITNQACRRNNTLWMSDGKRMSEMNPDGEEEDLQTSAAFDPDRILHSCRKAETIIRQRTDRILLVLERPQMQDNFLG